MGQRETNGEKKRKRERKTKGQKKRNGERNIHLEGRYSKTAIEAQKGYKRRYQGMGKRSKKDAIGGALY